MNQIAASPDPGLLPREADPTAGLPYPVPPTLAAAAPAREGQVAPPRGVQYVLRDALLDSRQRWRDLLFLAADFAFETDAWGRFIFVAPDPALGWDAKSLIGENADTLLAGPDASHNFNPFRPTGPVRRRHAWLRRPDGTPVCVAFAAAPILDGNGGIIGARGAGHDVTRAETHDATVAVALRRGELLDHILWRMRQEVLAPRMMHTALEAITAALAASGCAVIDMLGDGVEPTVLHQQGELPAPVRDTALTLLEQAASDPACGTAAGGEAVLVCPSQTRHGEQVGLALWRAATARPAAARPWDADERILAASVIGILRVVLEHEEVQAEMVRLARTDPLTGLLNRRAFRAEITRRIDRLEREGMPGTLMYVDLDHFKALNDLRGHEIGDEALCAMAELLRATLRPTDLVARLGGDEFAMWLDGADEFTAAERAESLRVQTPRRLAHLAGGLVPPLTCSTGIASRWPGRDEDIETLMHRADHAMYQVKRGGRGRWLVSKAE